MNNLILDYIEIYIKDENLVDFLLISFFEYIRSYMFSFNNLYRYKTYLHSS